MLAFSRPHFSSSELNGPKNKKVKVTAVTTQMSRLQASSAHNTRCEKTTDSFDADFSGSVATKAAGATVRSLHSPSSS